MHCPTFNKFAEKDHLDQYSDDEGHTETSLMTDGFAVDFLRYVSKTSDYAKDEFFGDRVFNLEMARRLCLMHSATAAKAAISVYTSNKVMTEAMEYMNIDPFGDCLASDLEVACSIAHSAKDQMFINTAVQKVIAHGVKSTGYNDQWFEETGKTINKREKNRHRTMYKTFSIDYTKDPVSQLMQYLDTNQMPHPVFSYHQSKDLMWHARAEFKGIPYTSSTNSKKECNKVIAFKILESL